MPIRFGARLSIARRALNLKDGNRHDIACVLTHASCSDTDT
jgi:hypothetical protein